MRRQAAKFLEHHWYGGGHAGMLLAPLSWLYRSLLAVHRRQARRGRVDPGVPVIVVGNITVGGTGKTPLVIWLVERLRDLGLRPGVVTRGYLGAASAGEPAHVFADTPAAQAGDEAVLLARRLRCPVVACRNRVLAAQSLVAEDRVDVIVSDDGLQHYALKSDFDIVVVDGARGLGNGRLLPAGPLREPPERLDSADLICVNGSHWSHADAVQFELHATRVVQLSDGSQLPLSAFSGRRVHAAAAIGNPARFFDMLRSAGCIVEERAWPDHALIPQAHLSFADGDPVLITEKDAVKYAPGLPDGIWSVNVDVRFADTRTATRIMQKISERLTRDSQRY